MNKGITVNELLKSCQEQVAKGNGDKYVLITDDDEMNGVHTAFYTLTDDHNLLTEAIEIEHDHSHTVDEVVLLG